MAANWPFRVSIWIALAIWPLVEGCDDDSRYVHSASTPPSYTADSITWIPLKHAGDNDLWFYVPDAAAYAGSKSKDTPYGFTIDVFVAGQIWRVTKHSDGFTYDDPADPPDAGPSGEAVFGMIILSAVALGGIAFGIHSRLELHSQKEAVKEVKNDLKTVRASEKQQKCQFEQKEAEFEKRQRDLERKQQADQRDLQAERVGLQTQRNELEQQQKIQAAAARDAKIQRKPPTQEEWQSLGDAVRAHQFRGRGTSDHLIVDYYFDPKNSGALVFMWEITAQFPYPPALVVLRDGKEFHRESGMFRGEFPCRLLKPNRRYKYAFRLYNGQTLVSDELLLELTIPPFAAFDKEAPKPLSEEEKKRKKESWKNTQYRYAEGFIKDPAKLKEKKAAIDQEANEQFGEI